MLYILGEDPLPLLEDIWFRSSEVFFADNDGGGGGGGDGPTMSFFFLLILGALSIAILSLVWHEKSDTDSWSSDLWSMPLWSPTVLTDLPGEPIENGVCGLFNLGNSCYMSASVQCLNSVVQLRDLIRQEGSLDLINEDNRLGSGGRVVRKFKDLIDRMWGGEITVAAPTFFKAEMGALNADFAGRQQQDAQEFMSWLLDKLHEDMNMARGGNALELRVRGESFDHLSDEQRSQRSFEEYLSQNVSPIDVIFNGQESSVLHW